MRIKHPSLAKLFDSADLNTSTAAWVQGVSCIEEVPGFEGVTRPIENLEAGFCWCLAARIELMFGGAALHDDSPIAQAVTAAIRSLFPMRVNYPRLPRCPAMEIIRFNDHPNTMFEDVELVLKFANRNLEKETVTP